MVVRYAIPTLATDAKERERDHPPQRYGLHCFFKSGYTYIQVELDRVECTPVRNDEMLATYLLFRVYLILVSQSGVRQSADLRTVWPSVQIIISDFYTNLDA